MNRPIAADRAHALPTGPSKASIRRLPASGKRPGGRRSGTMTCGSSPITAVRKWTPAFTRPAGLCRKRSRRSSAGRPGRMSASTPPRDTIRENALPHSGRSSIRPRVTPWREKREPAVEPSEPIVAAMGPIGHVYVDQVLDRGERERLAQSLVERAKIPMVTVVDGRDHVRVWTEGRTVRAARRCRPRVCARSSLWR